MKSFMSRGEFDFKKKKHTLWQHVIAWLIPIGINVLFWAVIPILILITKFLKGWSYGPK